MKQRKTTYTLERELTAGAVVGNIEKANPYDPKLYKDNDYVAKGLKKFESVSDVETERSAGSRIHSIGAYSIAGVCGFIFALLMAIAVYRIVVLDTEPLSIMEFLNFFETIDIIPYNAIMDFFNSANDALNTWGAETLNGFGKFIVAIPLVIVNIVRVLGVVISGVYYMFQFVVYLMRLTLW